jgi:predicted GNAT family acetyltransferase
LLQSVEGWDCVNVESRCATALGAIVEREMQCRVRYYGDVHHVLTVPARTFSHQAVRRLTVDDLELLARAPHQVRGAGFHSSRELLEQGIVACAVISGEVVSIAHTYARTRHYADIGVHTLEEWRGRGFAAAAASLVARLIQQAGQIPVWSAGEDNQASLGLAKKLGFTEISRRTYVIPDPRT